MTEKCGCVVTTYKTHDFLLSDYKIDFCPLHAAAPLLLEALKMVEWKQNSNDDTVCPWCEWEWNTHHPDCPRQAAIAAAEPEEHNG